MLRKSLLNSILVSFLTYFLICTIAVSQNTIVYNVAEEILNIGKSSYLLEDKSGNLTFQDVMSGKAKDQFYASTSDIPNFGNTRSVIWCKFTISNRSSSSCYIELAKPLLQKITFFHPDSTGSYKSRTTGALFHWNTREVKDNFFIFSLLPPNHDKPATFYLRIESEESIEIPLRVASLEKMFPEHNREELISGIFIGFMIVMMLYHFLIYLRLGDKIYFLYALFLFFAMFMDDMMVSGMAFEFLWPGCPHMNFYINAIAAMVNITLILFSARFLFTRKYTPLLHRGFIFFYIINGAVIATNILGEYFISSLGVQLSSFLLAIYMTITGWVAYKKGKTSAKFYLMGFAMLYIGGVIYILNMNNLLPYSTFSKDLPFIASSVSILLFSFAMADNLQKLRKAKEKAQAEKLGLIAGQNIQLEKMVQLRTEEIATQNEEIASQYEELLANQDQIEAKNVELEVKNTQLEKAHKQIEEQNLQLTRYSEGLEDEINTRTNDLFKKNQELIEQNHQMEQFSYITAHNLRSPIARIQGLCSIIAYSEEEEKNFIIQQIHNAGKELDRVISELGRVLEVKKGKEQAYELVNLEDKFERVKDGLHSEIKSAEATILADFSLKKMVLGVPVYIESILHNLLSNSLKYRSAERKLVISIIAKENNGKVRITFSDNGIGIDLEKYRNNIFGIYKRFHTHVEGKGLGLHLVKSEVESMSGKIEVESEVEKGTTFNIWLPYK